MKDKTCLLIGNGPSLRDVPLSLLFKYPTFGANGIFKLFSPTHYIYVDPDKQKFNLFADDINRTNSIKYIVRDYAKDIQDSIPLNITHENGFSYTPLANVYAYFSVATVMFQLAYWMGFDTVYMVGFDHRYRTPEGARDYYPAEADTNHFVKNYYPAGTTWKAPDLKKLEAYFVIVRNVYEKDKRRIINLTPDTALDVFEKGTL